MAVHHSRRPFTVALLSDIHGNLTALEAVLADLGTQPHDQLVITGDLVMNGPHPAEALARIRALNVPTLFGETDRAVVAAATGLSDHPLARWTADQIGPAGVACLESLAFSHRITPPQQPSPEADLLIVHATPTSASAFLILEPNPLDSRCAAVTPEAEALALFGETNADITVHGHLHYVSSGLVRDRRVISIGAVGFPFDGNPQAAYALVSWDGNQWRVVHRRVAYDYESVIAAVTRSGQPQADTIVHRLRTACWCA